MMRIITTTTALALAAGAAQAGGIDRSGQNIGILFEEGRVVELSLGRVVPSVEGTDLAIFGSGETGNVADSYWQLGLSYKQDLNDRLSLALIYDQPFGADILYDTTSVALGSTRAFAESDAVTGLLRYKLNDNVSVHGGLRIQRAGGEIDLRGAAYRSPLAPTTPGSGFDGYSVELEDDIALGYVIGAAYERPDIALRVALTYNSEITHEFDTRETANIFPPTTSTTEVKTPQSVNLDFQTGIAADTLLFGQIRWAEWSAFRIDPLRLTTISGGGLIDLEDTVTYSIGVGRRFNETWSGSISYTYEPAGDDDLVSPLAPTNGRQGITLAAVYTQDNVKVTTGINYTWLGDADAETGTPDTARANFRDNHSVGVGVRIAYSF